MKKILIVIVLAMLFSSAKAQISFAQLSSLLTYSAQQRDVILQKCGYRRTNVTGEGAGIMYILTDNDANELSSVLLISILDYQVVSITFKKEGISTYNGLYERVKRDFRYEGTNKTTSGEMYEVNQYIWEFLPTNNAGNAITIGNFSYYENVMKGK